MGWGNHIVLVCECGFQTERAMVGHLLGHESSHGGYTAIEASYDAPNQRIMTHTFTLPRELENLLDSDATENDEATVNRWFDAQRELVRKEHGHILGVPKDDHVTEFHCPSCEFRKLILKDDGSWIA
jgi:hypothetical protein